MTVAPVAFTARFHPSPPSACNVVASVTSFSPGRFAWRIRQGSRELSHRLGGKFMGALSDRELASAGAAIGLGNAPKKHPRGLETRGSLGLHFRPGQGAVFAGSDQEPQGRA